MDVKIVLMFIIAENTESVNIIQTIESDHMQLLLIAAAVQGRNDNDKTNMFGFKMCLIKLIIMCIQVFKQTIILEQIKHFVEFLKNKSQNMKF